MATLGRPRLAEEPVPIRTKVERTFRDDVQVAAAKRGVTVAEYVRIALAEQMRRDEKARRVIA